MIKRILASSLSLVTENFASYTNTVRLYNFKLKWGGGGGKGGEGEGEREGGVKNLLTTFLTAYWQKTLCKIFPSMS